MKRRILATSLILLSTVLYGCDNSNDVATTAEEKVTEKNESTTNIKKSGHKKEEQLSQEINHLKKEKEMFLQAKEHGKTLFWSLVHGDSETLDNLLSDKFQVFDDKIIEEDGQSFDIPFNNYAGEEAKVVVNNFSLEGNKLLIMYDIQPSNDEGSYHLGVTFVEDAKGDISIENFYFDA